MTYKYSNIRITYHDVMQAMIGMDSALGSADDRLYKGPDGGRERWIVAPPEAWMSLYEDTASSGVDKEFLLCGILRLLLPCLTEAGHVSVYDVRISADPGLSGRCEIYRQPPKGQDPDGLIFVLGDP